MIGRHSGPMHFRSLSCQSNQPGFWQLVEIAPDLSKRPEIRRDPRQVGAQLVETRPGRDDLTESVLNPPRSEVCPDLSNSIAPQSVAAWALGLTDA